MFLEIDADIVDWLRFILIGVIISSTYRWCRLLIAERKLKKYQTPPNARNYHIDSSNTLKSILKIRGEKVRPFMKSSQYYYTLNFNYEEWETIKCSCIENSENYIDNIYEGISSIHPVWYLIPNEDIKFVKPINESEKEMYYMNDEILVRLSHKEKEIKQEKEKKRKDRAIEKEKKMRNREYLDKEEQRLKI